MGRKKPAQQTPPPRRRIATLVAVLRKRLFLSRLASGALATSALLAAAALALFATDRLTLFPAAVRLVLAVSFLGASLYLLATRVAAHVLRPPSLVDAAAGLERRFGKLAGFLLSAVELEISRAKSSSAPSGQMVALVLEEAASRIDPAIERAASQSLVTPREMAPAATSAFIWGVLLLVCPQQVGAFAGRFTRPLAGISYPSRTRIVSIDAARVTARGDGYSARVKAEGLLPAEALFKVTDASSGTRLVAERGREGVYELRLENVDGDFTFSAAVGDARSDQIDVAVVDRPGETSIAAVITPPSYTSLAPFEVTGGRLSAPAGSLARVSVSFNKPVVGARVVFEDGRGREAVLTEGGRMAGFEFEVTSSTTYRFELVDAEGFVNSPAATYTVTALADSPPAVELRGPDRDLTAVATAAIPIAVNARDDYAVTTLELCYSIERNGRKAADKRIVMAGGEGRGPLEKDLHESYLWDIGKLGLRPGDVLLFYIEAHDNLPGAGQPAASTRRRITIVTRRRKLAELRILESRLQARLNTLQRKQRRARQTTLSLLQAKRREL